MSVILRKDRLRLLFTLFCLSLITTPSLVLARQAETPVQAEHETYRLQVGDDITIKVFHWPELEDTVRIRPDGRISLMLVDEVDAAGISAEELDRILTDRYSKFYRDPEVTVIVRSFANHKVWVAGEVGQPGPMPLVGELSALTAVVQAGGFRPTARTDNVILIRKGKDDTPVVRKINLKDVINKGNADIELQPFDVVYVPMSRIAKVDKFVDQYIRQLIPVHLTAGFNYIIGDYRNILVP